MPRLLTPGAFVSPQYSDCLLKLFTISFFYKWLSCLEKSRLLLWISALRSSVKYSFDLSVIVLTKIYLHFCVHSLISSRIEVANESGSINVIFIFSAVLCEFWLLHYLVKIKLGFFFPHVADLQAFLRPSVVLFWSFLCICITNDFWISQYISYSWHVSLWVFSGTSKGSFKTSNHSWIIPQEFLSMF